MPTLTTIHVEFRQKRLNLLGLEAEIVIILRFSQPYNWNWWAIFRFGRAYPRPNEERLKYIRYDTTICASASIRRIQSTTPNEMPAMIGNTAHTVYGLCDLGSSQERSLEHCGQEGAHAYLNQMKFCNVKLGGLCMTHLPRFLVKSMALRSLWFS